MPELSNALSSWESFYVIVGSSAGALIGLQFVVITLLADRRSLARAGALSAFGTPTVVHFTGALLVSAIMSAPWPSLVTLSIPLGICGVGGLAYSAIVIRRARRQTDYAPVWQDWLWFAALPCVSYALLTAADALLRIHFRFALFAIAIAALVLLLVGIHNAWDSILHIVISSADSNSTRTD
jgi:hypothetical protein